MIIGKEFHIDAAHHLPYHEGKCSELHGHTWKITIEVEDTVGLSGMVMDFEYFSEVVEQVLDELDHKSLNSVLNNPTCENLTSNLWYKFSKRFGGKLYSIKIQEGEGGWAYQKRSD